MARPPSMRRKLFVDKFQYRMLLIHLAHFVAFIAVIFGALYLPLLIKLDDTSLSPMQKMELTNQFHALTERWMPALWVVFGLLIMSAAIVSHRLSGPLGRMRDALQRAAAGDLSRRLSIRQKDYLTREADAINELITSLGTKIGEMKRTQHRAEVALARLSHAVAPGGDAGEALETLRTEVARWKQSVDEFKVDGEESSPEEASRPQESPLNV